MSANSSAVGAEGAEPFLIRLSANSPELLQALTRRWSQWLGEGGAGTPEEIASATSLDQVHGRHRMAVLAATKGELAEALSAQGQAYRGEVSTPARPPRVGFVFPARGSEWLGMGRGLLASEPAFRAAFEECAAALRPHLDHSPLEQLCAEPSRSRLAENEVAQPLLFALGVALAALWRSWGVTPAAVVGYSTGEVAAAYVAGALSLEDAALIVCRRSQLLRKLAGHGGMRVFELSEQQALDAIAGEGQRLSIAAVQSERFTVLSGESAALAALAAKLEARGVFSTALGIDYASHSSQIDPLRADLLDALAAVRPTRASCALYSSLLGRQIDGTECDAGYWYDNLRQCVRFKQAVAAMAGEVDHLIELSPHPALLSAVEDTLLRSLGGVGGTSRRAHASLRRELSDRRALLATAAELFVAGVAVNGAGLRPSSARSRIRVPWCDEGPGANLAASPAAPGHDDNEPIAVVGMACRFAGDVDSPERLWGVLERGVDCVREIPADRAGDIDSWYDPAAGPGKTAVRSAAFLDSAVLSGFDPQFFGISPREAVSMDPQQRMLLEVSYEALERAGLAARISDVRTGVFVGLCGTDYWWELAKRAEAIDMFALTGNFHSFTAGRVAYHLDLSGPAWAVDTACSSSLVAVHQAVRSLRSRECDVVLAGGANVISPFSLMATSKMGAVAVDGRTKAFDAAADGTTRGEGCGVVVLRRLADAQAAGEPILAVIRGSALNHDGRSNGLTAPSVHAQEAVIRAALADAGLDAADVDYVEAHGTGTKLGDPIEIEALETTYGQPRQDGSICTVSALKTNIGHTEASAGVAGLMKCVLALQNRAIPGVLHFKTLNPHIDLAGSCLSIPRELQIWEQRGRRRAAVSAFGASGTNAHVVLEEAPRCALQAPRGGAHVLALSARSASGLAARVAELRAALQAEPGLALADCCHSLNLGRVHHSQRLAVVASSTEEALAKLAVATPASAPPAAAHVVFAFSKLPAWLRPEHELLRSEPVVQETLHRLEGAFRQRSGWSLLGSEAGVRGSRAAFALEFALGLALAELWRSFGVQPAVIHGEGEGLLAAAVAAGALAERDAIELAVQAGVEAGALAYQQRERATVPLELGAPTALDAELILSFGGMPRVGRQPVWSPSEQRAVEHVLEAVAQLYEAGLPIDFRGVHRARPGRTVVLPTYPFERKRYWAPTLEGSSAVARASQPAGLAGVRVTVAGSDSVYYERSVSGAAPAYLAQHRLFGTAILPATAHIEMMLASSRAESSDTWELVDVSFEEALALPDCEGRRLQVNLGPLSGEQREVALFAATEAGKSTTWTRHSRARLRRIQREQEWPGETLAELRARVVAAVDLDAIYARLERLGLEFGPDFRASSWAAAAEGEALGEISLAPHLRPADGYAAHPVLLDGCLQLAAAALGSLDACVRLPVRIESVCIRRPLGEAVFCHARRRTSASAPVASGSERDAVDTFDFRIFDRAGNELAQVSGVQLRRLASRSSLGFGASGVLDWLYQVGWRQRPLPPQAEARGGADGAWLLLADRAGLGAGLASRLAQRGTPCFLVHASSEWRRSGHEFWIRPDHAGDYQRLVSETRAEASKGIQGVLHLWSLDAPRGDLSREGLEQAEQLGPRSLLELLRSLGADELLPLVIATRGARAVRSEEVVTDLAGAMSWGFARSLALERAGLVRTLDLDPAGDRQVALARTELDRLVAELDARDGETEVALRGEQRWVSRLEATRPNQIGSEPYAWRKDGTYLVLGGLGDIGLEVARRMVAAGVPRIVLAGRSRPSPELEQELAALRLHADVVVARVDLAAPEQVRDLLRGASDSEFPLRGVVHSAAVIADAIVSNQTWQSFQSVFAAKVAGSRNLQVALEELGLTRQLDFVVYFSSGASVVGSAGQTNYAAANAYQDALASMLSARGQRVLSINWGAWAGAKASQERIRNSERRGVGPIDAERGLLALEHLLARSPEQVAVLPFRWAQLAELSGETAIPPLLSDLLARVARTGVAAGPSASAEQPGASGQTRQAVLTAPHEQRVALLTRFLREVVARALWLEPGEVPLGAPLVSLGMDSLVAVQIKHRVERELRVAVPVMELLGGAPVEKLAALLLDALQGDEPPRSPSAEEDLSSGDALQLLERIDELSDEEVRAQLARLMNEELDSSGTPVA